MATDERAFPQLDEEEVACVRTLATEQCYDDGAAVFRAGDSEVDLFVVTEGELRILNPSDDDREIARHGPGHFSGDIDLLTGRPAIVTAIACGRTSVLRVPSDKIRRLLNTIPRVSEKLMVAFQVRRHLLQTSGKLGLRVIGSKECRDTNLVREFLYKNFMPFTWYDLDSDEGKQNYDACGGGDTPIVDCNGHRLFRPSLRELSECAGVWRACPTSVIDLAVVGAGPAGLAAAVYGASEGLKTAVLDRIGPGGQAGGSSRIENFIGFPAGLSGADLATRGALQMMKFGAEMMAPIEAVTLDPQERGPHRLHLDCGSTLQAHHVLIATGATWRKLQAKGAERFERTGIYYACTTVESRLHEGEELAVVGGGNSAGQAAMFLAEHCAKHVHLLLRGKELGDTMSSYLNDRIAASDRITLHRETEIEQVLGENRVESIQLKRNSPGPTTLDVGAVFVFIGAEPRTDWLPESLARDTKGYLLTGMEMMIQGHWRDTSRMPCPLETSIPRVLAAGDVRAGSTKRVGFAVGDGSLAITCVHSLRRQMR